MACMMYSGVKLQQTNHINPPLVYLQSLFRDKPNRLGSLGRQCLLEPPLSLSLDEGQRWSVMAVAVAVLSQSCGRDSVSSSCLGM